MSDGRNIRAGTWGILKDGLDRMNKRVTWSLAVSSER